MNYVASLLNSQLSRATPFPRKHFSSIIAAWSRVTNGEEDSNLLFLLDRYNLTKGLFRELDKQCDDAIALIMQRLDIITSP